MPAEPQSQRVPTIGIQLCVLLECFNNLQHERLKTDVTYNIPVRALNDLEDASSGILI